jgi:hypothetical protein
MAKRGKGGFFNNDALLMHSSVTVYYDDLPCKHKKMQQNSMLFFLGVPSQAHGEFHFREEMKW